MQLEKLLSDWIWIDGLRYPLKLDPIEILLFYCLFLNRYWFGCLSSSSGISSIYGASLLKADNISFSF